MDWTAYANSLLEEYYSCCDAKPRHDAINIQLEKDTCASYAKSLARQIGWGTENEIAEACHQFEPRLKKLQEKLILEILKHGSV